MEDLVRFSYEVDEQLGRSEGQISRGKKGANKKNDMLKNKRFELLSGSRSSPLFAYSDFYQTLCLLLFQPFHGIMGANKKGQIGLKRGQLSNATS